MNRYIAAATFALAAPLPLAAQDIPDLAERMEAARDAEEVARLIADVQGAVAIAQVQYAGMTGSAPDASYQGAIAIPGEELGVWDTVVIGSTGGGPDSQLVALAEYEIAQGEILSEVIHLPADRPAIDGSVAAMAEARGFAPRAVVAAGNTTFCADEGSGDDSVTFATIVLPPREDGSFDAYVLNGPIENGAIPLGRHFKVAFDQFGLSGEPELLTDTCEVITWDTENPELAMSVYVTEYPGGQAPNEIHTFISSLLPMSMGVITGEIIWPMAGGMIAPPVPAAEAGYAPTE